ncbi:MAG: dihydroorotate dehydrogenase-like protein [Bacteroidales bacterium]|nr:dihydroorotate dehydrogenase-like protein [Bacteroidales bacterium]
MDFSTEYMGLKLRNPIIVSSSRLTGELDNIRKCADVGAGAIVLKSIFEEQLLANAENLMDQDIKYFWFPEAIEHISKHSKEFGVKQMLQMIKQIKDYTDIPVISSINCVSAFEWPKFAKSLEEAGSDGIELNIAIFPFKKETASHEIEEQYVEIVRKVKEYVSIPVSVKLGSYFTNIFGMAHKLDDAGADGLVLFNRYYRPDIDIDKEIIVRDNFLSGPEEVTQSLRWVALLSPRLKCHLAGGTGIHDYKGVVKQLLAGAWAVQISSILYKNGISYIDTMLHDLGKWMQHHGYQSIADFRGKICRDEQCDAKFERMQFLRKEFD